MSYEKILRQHQIYKHRIGFNLNEFVVAVKGNEVQQKGKFYGLLVGSNEYLAFQSENMPSKPCNKNIKFRNGRRENCGFSVVPTAVRFIFRVAQEHSKFCFKSISIYNPVGFKNGCMLKIDENNQVEIMAGSLDWANYANPNEDENMSGSSDEDTNSNKKFKFHWIRFKVLWTKRTLCLSC